MKHFSRFLLQLCFLGGGDNFTCAGFLDNVSRMNRCEEFVIWCACVDHQGKLVGEGQMVFV